MAPQARLDLLNQTVRQFTYQVPFQNISLMAEAAEDRRLPVLEEIVDDVVAGKGGLCFTNNTFLKLALECLGFDAFHIAGAVAAPNSHIVSGVSKRGFRG